MGRKVGRRLSQACAHGSPYSKCCPVLPTKVMWVGQSLTVADMDCASLGVGTPCPMQGLGPRGAHAGLGVGGGAGSLSQPGRAGPEGGELQLWARARNSGVDGPARLRSREFLSSS